jgi:predicted protein tyrosine phosphatase
LQSFDEWNLSESEPLEGAFPNIAADFEDYYECEQQLQQQLSDMKLLRGIKNFLTKERVSPFCLDMPTDFAYGQWGI